jgi:hypothetical protein
MSKDLIAWSCLSLIVAGEILPIQSIPAGDHEEMSFHL